VFFRLANDDLCTPQLIHCIGNHELVVPFAHLNTTDKSKTFTRTALSALNEIRDIVEAQDAHMV
jgi:hypothetical protein